MEINEAAKKLLETRVSKAINNMDVDEKEKNEIRNELFSHFYDVSASIAQSRGTGVIEKEDVNAAFIESEDPEEIARAYMRSFVGTFVKAGIWSRTMAYLIDLILIGICVIILISPFMFLLGTFSIGTVPATHSDGWVIADSKDFGMYYSPLNKVAEVLLSFLTGIMILVTVLTYFIVIEGRFGFTPGKKLLSLKVLKDDGTRIGYKESIIRNIPKFINNLIILDAILMVIIYRKDRQRVFDKVANTIVVHTNKAR